MPLTTPAQITEVILRTPSKLRQTSPCVPEDVGGTLTSERIRASRTLQFTHNNDTLLYRYLKLRIQAPSACDTKYRIAELFYVIFVVLRTNLHSGQNMLRLLNQGGENAILRYDTKSHSSARSLALTARTASRSAPLYSDGELSLTTNLGGKDTIPPCAILSHTCGADSEEVTFEDLIMAVARASLAMRRSDFVETKLDKTVCNTFGLIHAALTKQTNLSSFRLSTPCSIGTATPLDAASTCQIGFLPAAAGIGLPEKQMAYPGLDAPRAPSTRYGIVLLQKHIYEMMEIPDSPLQGTPLTHFSVNERLSSNEHQHTKLEEDRAYSLLGIFDVYISPFYGEGAGGAFKPLMEEIDKLSRCIQGLHLTDPCDDKKCIKDTKGRLLKDSYHWVLGNADYYGLRAMLTKVRQCSSAALSTSQKGTDSRLNSATAVLRGLLYMLVKQQSSVISHIRKEHDHTGKALLEDANAWVALTEIFTNVLQDPSLSSTCLRSAKLVSGRVGKEWIPHERTLEAGRSVKILLEAGLGIGDGVTPITTQISQHLSHKSQITNHKSQILYSKKETPFSIQTARQKS
ncbi:uncharacterized protein BDR25DRAFT_359000 [Lindgomyces ingoldianus]|uniref:Uncharacterized protein n=1 Tax=Lindgomyces ingoldianus TaxID=673940 RepID=A0ACB6QLD6_9PLEO|nr:uncharacterized protein BDR25DRAFT_359000 [Lindgomyces ingoldianus]KAF2466941.1 hypothetical protein BDR25DRAFT_359000 [Lindgomyces ingoldianus]